MHPFSDYHLHPQGHRLQPYSQELLQPWADHACDIGLRDIALTDHDRYHRGVDFDEIDRLRAANPVSRSAPGSNWITIQCTRPQAAHGSNRTGTGSISSSVPSTSSWRLGLRSRRRGSGICAAQHQRSLCRLLRADSRDGDERAGRLHGSSRPGEDFGFRPTNDFSDVLDAVLPEIHGANLAMELSTAGWRKPVGELYPSDEIIRRAMEKGIPFTTASDGHSHVQQGENFDRLAEKMRALGIGEVCVFELHGARLSSSKRSRTARRPFGLRGARKRDFRLLLQPINRAGRKRTALTNANRA